MEFILAIAVVAAVLWFLSRGSSTGSRAARATARSSSSTDDSTDRQRILDANRRWLEERWNLAKTEKAAGQLKHFPHWWFDEPTQRQRERLQRDGVALSGTVTKGQLSDIIGLFEEPEADVLAKVKFFGVSLKGIEANQTRVRHEATKLDQHPDKVQLWLKRPASPIQKEFYKFIGEKAPRRLTYEEAEAKRDAALEALSEAHQDEWSAFESLVEEFEDREFRSDVEIRKPSPADIRAAMAALKAEGKVTIDDPYEVAEKLLDMKPGLARS